MVYVDYIGCEKRKLDAQRILDYYIANGYERTENSAEADYIVYVTCAFCKQYEDWSFENIKKLYQTIKNGSKLIIGGCMPSINPSRLSNFSNTDLITVRGVERLDEIINPKISIRNILDPNLTCFDNLEYETRKIDEKRTSGHNEYEEAKKGFKIRISEGCLGNCSYCVTRFATKKVLSKPISTIMKEFRKAIETNQSTIFLTGGDTGSYGQDISLTIVDLLKTLFLYKSTYKIYLHDFGIHWLIKYFNELLPLLKKYRDLIGVISFPIQSGSNKILKLMRRPYKIERVKMCLKKLKVEVPEIRIGTHIIVGFPNESEQDFLETMNLIDEVPFDFLMVFKYSDNPLADSFKLFNKIKEEEIELRYNRLLKKYYDNYYKNRWNNGKNTRFK